MVEYGIGWVATWIAGDQRLRVLSLTRPRFAGAIETIVDVGANQVNGTRISPEYWSQYHNLTQP